MKKCLVRLLGGEKWQMARISVFCILLSLLAGAVLLLVMGRNPLAAYGNFLQGSGLMLKAKYAGGQGMVTDFLNLLDALTPMIFASLAVAMKIGMFNIGVSGQMLTAAIFAHIVLPGWTSPPPWRSCW